eukprot:757153-Hanusia_phi.AAC.1
MEIQLAMILEPGSDEGDDCFLARAAQASVVGGSDLAKAKEQLGDDYLEIVDWAFPENGLNAFKDGKSIEVQSLKKHLGEDNIKRLVNWILRYLADVDIPVKRGTFIEFRNGMINVSPIGRNCSQEERDAFEQFDHVGNVFSHTSSTDDRSGAQHQEDDGLQARV